MIGGAIKVMIHTSTGLSSAYVWGFSKDPFPAI